VFKRLSAFLTSNQKSVDTLWLNLGQLIESKALSTSLEDSLSGILGELEGTNFHFRNDYHSLVIENVSDQDDDFVSLLFAVGDFSEFGDRHRISSGSGLVESLIDDSVEIRLGSSGQEFVELDQQLMVVIAGSGLSVVSELNSLLFEEFCHGL
jgi:hypothetical protein